MTNSLAIFDRRLLRLRRARIAASIAQHDFLHMRVAEDIAARLAAVTRDFPLALDLGAQHGPLGRALLALGKVGELISADSTPELLAYAPGSKVVCDEEVLPFAPASLDLVVSGMALHVINDLPGLLAQIRRALKPDGLFMAALLGGRTLHELRDALTLAQSEIEGGLSPRVAPFADLRDLGALLQRAGFALPVADADAVEVSYATMFDLMHELRAMGASNVLREGARRSLKRATLFRAAEMYAERFPAQGRRVKATFELIYLTGWAPHESQQKPLKPGTARQRLADALGVEERRTGIKAGPGTPPTKRRP